MATATAAAPMAISQNLLLTLPPPTRSDFRGRTGGEYPLLLNDFQAIRFRFGSGSPAPLTMRWSRSGGTGRRAGLKIRFPSGSVGSIPTFGTLDAGKRRSHGRARQSLHGKRPSAPLDAHHALFPRTGVNGERAS